MQLWGRRGDVLCVRLERCSADRPVNSEAEELSSNQVTDQVRALRTGATDLTLSRPKSHDSSRLRHLQNTFGTSLDLPFLRRDFHPLQPTPKTNFDYPQRPSALSAVVSGKTAA